MIRNITSRSINKLTVPSLKRMPLSYSRHTFSSFRGGYRGKDTSFMSGLIGGAALLTVGALTASFCSSTTALCAASAGSAEAMTDSADKFANSRLFPPIQPYAKGKLQVDDRHTIAYSLYGNKQGKPVLFVHGGPGGGTDPFMARYFDPKAYHIILVDQRGCGESTPFADLTNNTTYDSIRDFEKLRVKLGIEKWQLFGGSWGSTLALAYAIEHPQRVTELVLRGIFLLREKELDWLYEDKGSGGCKFIYPEEWEAYERVIPVEERGNFMVAYGKRLRGEMGEQAMKDACKAWSIWEGSVSKLVQDDMKKVQEKFGDDQFSLAFARIENHYFLNKGFFPRDGFLLEKENCDKIRHIPTVIVQGRYDVVCPAISAYELTKALPHAEITYTLTGHSSVELPIIEGLVKATEKFKDVQK